jgi:hypothetical protein
MKMTIKNPTLARIFSGSDWQSRIAVRRKATKMLEKYKKKDDSARARTVKYIVYHVPWKATKK